MKIKIYPTSWEINLEAEIQQRRNLLGWQRDNIEIYIQGKTAHKFASEGQQRTAALALRAAEYIILRKHSSHHPLVLVDDVLGELDTARREALTSLLDPDCQLIITSTKTEEINRKKTVMKPATINLS
jgi:DNA replication and repair protein RecF